MPERIVTLTFGDITDLGAGAKPTDAVNEGRRTGSGTAGQQGSRRVLRGAG